MILIVVFIILGVLVAIGAAAPASEAFWAAAGGALLGGMAALLLGMVLYSGSSNVALAPVKLESLVDGSDLRGSFFLGSGTINDVATYTWYEQTEDNTFVQRSTNADDAKIHFLPSGSKQRPYYVAHAEIHPDGPILDTWGFRLETGTRYITSYDFYVPKDTITRQFELDAK